MAGEGEERPNTKGRFSAKEEERVDNGREWAFIEMVKSSIARRPPSTFALASTSRTMDSQETQARNLLNQTACKARSNYWTQRSWPNAFVSREKGVGGSFKFGCKGTVLAPLHPYLKS